jgi:hypothetical protein
VVVIVIGVVQWWNGVRLRRGRDARAVLVVGAVTCVGLWPLLLVVPAIVLQHHRDSQRWFSLPQADPPSPA